MPLRYLVPFSLYDIQLLPNVWHYVFVRKNWSHSHFLSRFLFCYFQKEKKILETKRLDLDSCKSRLRKAKQVASQTQVSHGPMSSYKGGCLHWHTLTPTPNATKYKFLEDRSRYWFVIWYCLSHSCSLHMYVKIIQLWRSMATLQVHIRVSQ